TAAPQLTVLHGRSEIGQIDPMVLRTPQEGTRTLTLAGRGWRVTSVDWNRQRVQVEPWATGGSVRWFGLPQPLSQPLARAIRRILQGEDPGRVGLTRRAASKVAALREEYADRKSTRLNSSHVSISYAVFCLKKNNTDELDS